MKKCDSQTLEPIELEGLLQKGTFASVHRGTIGGKACAIKLIKKEHEQHASVEREIQALHALAENNGRNFPQLYACCVLKEQRVLIMTLVEGRDLYDVSESWFRTHSGAPPKTPTLLCSALESLCVVHAYGWAHGDIKLENMVHRRADDAVVLVDFGSATNAQSPMRDGILITPEYAAPEMISAFCRKSAHEALETLQAADVFSLGISFWIFQAHRRTPLDDAVLEGWERLQSVSEHLTEKLVAVEHADPLLRRLMHPKWAQRPTAQQALRQNKCPKALSCSRSTGRRRRRRIKK